MSQKKEMVGDYEVLQSIRLGGRVVILGQNPKSKDETYMTCYEQHGFFGGIFYPEAVAGNDYAEIMQIFLTRLQEQQKVVGEFRKSRTVPVMTLDREYCRKREADESLEGKLIILRPSSLAPEYRTADCQLGIATGGFGCNPGAGGRAVYFQELYSGEECRWNIGDVLGIADLERIPDWAKDKMADREKSLSAIKKKREAER